ncbi:hypothetical protein GGI12_005633, partial [Dipsacomyces acuminosporus]
MKFLSIAALAVVAIASVSATPGRHHSSSKTRTTSSAPSHPQPTSTNPSGTFNGDGTYYDPGVGLGSCGKLHKGTELIAALNAP